MGLSDTWSPWALATLRFYWGKEDASSIARRLNTTKNAVIGKARRLALPKLATRSTWEAVLDTRPLCQMPMVAEPEKPNGLRCGLHGCGNTRQPGRTLCADHIRQRIKEWRDDYLQGLSLWPDHRADV